MEVKDWTYEEMPEFTQNVEGATIVETSGDEIEIKYLHDVAYQSADGATLRLQVLSPTSRNGIAGPLPCIVFVKGSAWRTQKLYMLIPQLAQIARRGYVVVEVEYRPASQAAFPARSTWRAPCASCARMRMSSVSIPRRSSLRAIHQVGTRRCSHRSTMREAVPIQGFPLGCAA